jgi:hypothetical protein
MEQQNNASNTAESKVALDNKNEKQLNFNNIKGIITELNDGDKFCSITLNVGHENVRDANLVMKKTQFEEIKSKFNIGDKVFAKYYLTSHFKNGRWYTMAKTLSVESVK